jgi:amino acid transporter
VKDEALTLKRSLNLPLLAFYGLGSIVGAGIYVLVGEVAGVAGQGIGLSFLLAGIIAGLTGATYAELSSRYPRSAGAALFVDIAFRSPWFSRLVAAMMIFTGIISSAAICQGFVGYFQLHIDMPTWTIIISLCLLMFLIASWGIRESASLIAVITLIEVGGLLLVMQQTSRLDAIGSLADLVDTSNGTGAIIAGAFLAFYAFIGFEDMVNVAEEVKDPITNMPRGILAAVVLSCILYLGIAVAVVLYVDINALSKSTSPLALMVGHSPTSIWVISLISMFAVINGALVQIIMSARILYGMAQRRLLPMVFGHLNPRTRTPIFNTLLITITIMLLALTFPLVTLAKITSAMMLVIFMIVNASLIRIKSNPVEAQHKGFTLPMFLPIVSLICATFLLLAQFTLEY